MLDHTLGGTIWKIRPPVVSTIVFAVNMNHTRKHHLDETVLVSVTDVLSLSR
jgi:cleavage and polyadenylation specificity factor subunit 2